MPLLCNNFLRDEPFQRGRRLLNAQGVLSWRIPSRKEKKYSFDSWVNTLHMSLDNSLDNMSLYNKVIQSGNYCWRIGERDSATCWSAFTFYRTSAFLRYHLLRSGHFSDSYLQFSPILKLPLPHIPVSSPSKFDLLMQSLEKKFSLWCVVISLSGVKRYLCNIHLPRKSRAEQLLSVRITSNFLISPYVQEASIWSASSPGIHGPWRLSSQRSVQNKLKLKYCPEETICLSRLHLPWWGDVSVKRNHVQLVRKIELGPEGRGRL